jgi:hypothetical protein
MSLLPWASSDVIGDFGYLAIDLLDRAAKMLNVLNATSLTLASL